MTRSFSLQVVIHLFSSRRCSIWWQPLCDRLRRMAPPLCRVRTIWCMPAGQRTHRESEAGGDNNAGCLSTRSNFSICHYVHFLDIFMFMFLIVRSNQPFVCVGWLEPIFFARTSRWSEMHPESSMWISVKTSGVSTARTSSTLSSRVGDLTSRSKSNESRMAERPVVGWYAISFSGGFDRRRATASRWTQRRSWRRCRQVRRGTELLGGRSCWV